MIDKMGAKERKNTKRVKRRLVCVLDVSLVIRRTYC